MSNEINVEALATGNTIHRSRLEITNLNRRVVHVTVSEKVFNHAKAQAYLSGLSWKEYIERLLSEAKPLDQTH